MTEEQANKKRLIITIDQSLHRELKVEAALRSTTMNAIINKALKAYDFRSEVTQNLTVGASEK